MAVVDELVTLINYQLDSRGEATLKAAKQGVIEMASKIALLSAAVIAAKNTFQDFMSGVVNNSMELQKLSDDTGMSTTSLQEWGYAAGKLGGDAKSVQSDIARLQKTMSDPFSGIANMELMKLGVSTSGKTVVQVFDQIADKLGKMDRLKAIQWGAKLGLSDDTVRVFRQGGDALAKLKQEAHSLGGIIDEKQIKAASEFWKRIYDLKFEAGALAEKVGMALIPKLGALWDFLTELLSPVTKFIKGLVDTDSIGGLITGTFAAFLVLLSPFIAKVIAITAGIVALGMAIEDVIAYFTGGPSLIGAFFDAFHKRYPAMYDALKMIGSVFKDVIVAEIKFTIRTIEIFFSVLKSTFGWVMDIVEKTLSLLGFGDKGTGTDFANSFSKTTANFVDMLKGNNGEMGGFVQGFKNFQTQPGGISQSTTDSRTIQITVNDSGNPKATAGAIGNYLMPSMINTPGSFAPVHN